MTVSALESPIIRQCGQLADAYSSGSSKLTISSYGSATPDSSFGSSLGSSLSSELINSPMAEDLVALSPNKLRSEVFPDEMPPHVIRQAMAVGFGLDDIVAVMYVVHNINVYLQD